jgi:hypothetical protein
VLFGPIAAGHGVTRSTRRAVLYCVRVAGIPAIHVEEAMWTCLDVLAAAEATP